MNKLYINLLTVSAVAIMGCGGGSSSSSSDDGFKIHKVAYTLNGTKPPTCPNARVTLVKAQKDDDIGIQDCIWLCGDYEGSIQTVLLSFQQNGKNGIWEFDNELVSTKPTQCHN